MANYIELMKKIAAECRAGKRTFTQHSVYIGDLYKQIAAMQLAEKIVEFTKSGAPVAKQQTLGDISVEVFHQGGWFVRTKIGKLQVINFITQNN